MIILVSMLDAKLIDRPEQDLTRTVVVAIAKVSAIVYGLRSRHFNAAENISRHSRFNAGPYLSGLDGIKFDIGLVPRISIRFHFRPSGQGRLSPA